MPAEKGFFLECWPHHHFPSKSSCNFVLSSLLPLHTFLIQSTWLWDGFEGHKIQVEESFLTVGKGGAQSTLHEHIYTYHLRDGLNRKKKKWEKVQFSRNYWETIYQEETRAWAQFVWKLFSAQAQENLGFTISNLYHVEHVSGVAKFLPVWHDRQHRRWWALRYYSWTLCWLELSVESFFISFSQGPPQPMFHNVVKDGYGHLLPGSNNCSSRTDKCTVHVTYYSDQHARWINVLWLINMSQLIGALTLKKCTCFNFDQKKQKKKYTKYKIYSPQKSITGAT